MKTNIHNIHENVCEKCKGLIKCSKCGKQLCLKGKDNIPVIDGHYKVPDKIGCKIICMKCY